MMTDLDTDFKLLFITPKRLVCRSFMSLLDRAYKIGTLAWMMVDEIHSISQ